jgi:hypothetical protein
VSCAGSQQQGDDDKDEDPIVLIRYRHSYDVKQVLLNAIVLMMVKR